MSDIKNLPEPYYLYRDSYYGRDICTTPYTSFYWLDIIKKYEIKIPEIIDRTMGKSTCCKCKAVYAGNQPNCTAPVYYHVKPSGYKETGFHPTYPILFQECLGYLNWDLQNEFSLQSEFFNLLEKIQKLTDIQYDPLYKFQSSFSPEAIDGLKIRLLERSVNESLLNIQVAISQIANKMNNAGACLSFNF
jgi:hypothetical protein